jgi:RimJ/RimL family protein N-acetyltransferase
MISATEANEDTKFFTHHWTITLPTHPSLKYIHTTISHLDPWLALLSDPTNHPHDEHSRTKVWDEAAISEFRKTTSEKYIASYTSFNALQMLIEKDGEIIGAGNYFLLPTGWVNIGLLISEKARGKGLGKLSMKVLVELARRMGVEKLAAGTMKANKQLQAMMASLKIQGKEEGTEVPGRGVVGEIKYAIPETVGWEDLDLKVEFGAPASE